MPPTGLTCPQCGTPLQVRVPPTPDRCPLICQVCARGWWPAELDRPGWDPDTRAWPASHAADVVAFCNQDRAALAVLLADRTSRPDRAQMAAWVAQRRQAHRDRADAAGRRP